MDLNFDFSSAESIIPSTVETKTEPEKEEVKEVKSEKNIDPAESFFNGNDEIFEKVKESAVKKEQSEKDSDNTKAEQTETDSKDYSELLKDTNFKTLEDMKKSALSATEKIRTQSEELKQLKAQIEKLSNPEAQKDNVDGNKSASGADENLANLSKLDKEDLEAFGGYLDEETTSKVVSLINTKVKKAVDSFKNDPVINALRKEHIEKAEIAEVMGDFQEAKRQYYKENPNMTADEEKAIHNFFATKGKIFENILKDKTSESDDKLRNIKEIIAIAHLSAKGSNVDSYLKLASENADKKVSEMVSAIASGKVQLQPRDKQTQTKKTKTGYTASDYFAGKNPVGKSNELH